MGNFYDYVFWTNIGYVIRGLKNELKNFLQLSIFKGEKSENCRNLSRLFKKTKNLSENKKKRN